MKTVIEKGADMKKWDLLQGNLSLELGYKKMPLTHSLPVIFQKLQK